MNLCCHKNWDEKRNQPLSDWLFGIVYILIPFDKLTLSYGFIDIVHRCSQAMSLNYGGPVGTQSQFVILFIASGCFGYCLFLSLDNPGMMIPNDVRVYFLRLNYQTDIHGNWRYSGHVCVRSPTWSKKKCGTFSPCTRINAINKPMALFKRQWDQYGLVIHQLLFFWGSRMVSVK